MQALKNKLNDWKALSKAKAEAKAEEKEEKDIENTRIEVAHEVRLAKEADAEVEFHLAKAEKKAEEDITKQTANIEKPVETMAPTGPTLETTDPRIATAHPTNNIWSSPGNKHI